MNVRLIQFVITFGALSVALIHTYAPGLTIDGTTVSLLAIAVLPWLAPLFKAIELPGGVKIQFQDFINVEAKAEDAGLLVPAQESLGKDRHIYAFESVAENDPNLALAGLRIELEAKLREIAEARGIEVTRKSIRPLIRDLKTRDVLNQREVSALEDMLPLLNSAAHGAETDLRATDWAMDVGPRLLAALDEKIGEKTITQLLERWKTRDRALVAEIGIELSKALVTSPKTFLASMRDDEEGFKAWLDGMQDHTFTLFESRGELDDDLYTAYYEKLRELMTKALKPLLESEYSDEVKRVISALDAVSIKRIW
jgi:hypothetical protein